MEHTTTADAAKGDIQVVARVAALLGHFTPHATSIDALQAAVILGVGRSSAHRYLVSMERSGLLSRADATTYELGPALRRLGTLALATTGLVEAAGPPMRDLASQIRSTIVLSVWGGSAPVVARVVLDSSRPTKVSIDVGQSLEPEAAQSRVFAAYLAHDVTSVEGVRTRTTRGGHVTVAVHTYVEGALKAIAVPILASDGQIVGTLAALGFTGTLRDEQDEQVIELLLAAAARLERR